MHNDLQNNIIVMTDIIARKLAHAATMASIRLYSDIVKFRKPIFTELLSITEHMIKLLSELNQQQETYNGKDISICLEECENNCTYYNTQLNVISSMEDTITHLREHAANLDNSKLPMAPKN
jgi:hypothetical protein